MRGFLYHHHPGARRSPFHTLLGVQQRQTRVGREVSCIEICAPVGVVEQDGEGVAGEVDGGDGKAIAVHGMDGADEEDPVRFRAGKGRGFGADGGKVIVVEWVGFGAGVECAEDGAVGEIGDIGHFCGCR